MSTILLACLCGGLLIWYVKLTSNKKIVDTNKKFTHADITTGYTTTTYVIINYDYPKDSGHIVKIWPDRDVNPEWPEMIQASAGSIKLYSLKGE